MAKLKFAIMGATGHIGHVLAETLLAKGHHVRALGRDPAKLQSLKAKGAEIYTGDCTNAAFLTKAFQGCDAVFTMFPAAHPKDDIEVFVDRTGEAVVNALAKANISYVLNLSSVGASHRSGTGIIKKLHQEEERLNLVPHLNVLHFRPNFFMENFEWYIPMIKTEGKIATSLKADVPVMMVATNDIAHKMAEKLEAKQFKGSSIFDFVGPRAVTMIEATKVIGKALGKPDLKYVSISYAQEEKEHLAMGMTHQLSKLLTEMHRAANEGLILPTQELTADHKGTTTIEAFAKTFVQMVRGSKKAA